MLKRFFLWCRNISRINNAYRHANELFGEFNNRLRLLESEDVRIARAIQSNQAVLELDEPLRLLRARVNFMAERLALLEQKPRKPKGRPVKKKGRAK